MIWPLPALAAWGLAWLVFLGAVTLRLTAWLGLAAATLVGVALAALGTTTWRRIFIAGGFPVMLAISGAGESLPAWTWLVPLAGLWLLYPMSSWRDAPLFPTPSGGLRGLAALAPLPAGARVLDAGCGLGDGLRELHREYPQARLDGLEWSWPIALACMARCGFARVRRGDIWTAAWSGYQMVYLFQRPETMPRAVDKAARELPAGAWMASLEFEARDLEPRQVLRCPDGRPVWLYQSPFRRREDTTT
ncbi:MAG: class I SAM-dependent methyltransferase [Vicinamibacterales bacterium]